MCKDKFDLSEFPCSEPNKMWFCLKAGLTGPGLTELSASHLCEGWNV